MPIIYRDEDREDTIPSQAWEIKEPKNTEICLHSATTHNSATTHSQREIQLYRKEKKKEEEQQKVSSPAN